MLSKQKRWIVYLYVLFIKIYKCLKCVLVEQVPALRQKVVISR
jgi:hypothetical protein